MDGTLLVRPVDLHVCQHQAAEGVLRGVAVAVVPHADDARLRRLSASATPSMWRTWSREWPTTRASMSGRSWSAISCRSAAMFCMSPVIEIVVAVGADRQPLFVVALHVPRRVDGEAALPQGVNRLRLHVLNVHAVVPGGQLHPEPRPRRRTRPAGAECPPALLPAAPPRRRCDRSHSGSESDSPASRSPWWPGDPPRCRRRQRSCCGCRVTEPNFPAGGQRHALPLPHVST